MENSVTSCIGVPEMAKRLGLSLPTAYRLASSEGFPAFRVGRRWLVNEKMLEKWVNEQSNSGKEE